MEKEEIIDTIKQFACSLAEKELVDKYGKLPEQLMTKRGDISFPRPRKSRGQGRPTPPTPPP